VIMGLMSEQELRSVPGLPLAQQSPGMRTLLSSTSKSAFTNELLIVITPHVVRKPFHDEARVFLDSGSVAHSLPLIFIGDTDRGNSTASSIVRLP